MPLPSGHIYHADIHSAALSIAHRHPRRVIRDKTLGLLHSLSFVNELTQVNLYRENRIGLFGCPH